MTPLEIRARAIIDRAVGPGKPFRDGQFECIQSIVLDGGRRLVVQRTGWGKSTVYFTATCLLRESGRGATIVISPLLALTRDQLRNARERFGLTAEAINSTNPEQHEDILGRWAAGKVDVLYITPERLAKRREFERILSVAGGIGLFVIDEAHCISDWGHDFRPDFRRIVGFLAHLDSSVAVLCTTATANARVVKDIQEQVGTMAEVRGPLARQSLHVDIIALPSHAERMAWLARNLGKLPGSGIIYALTQRDAEIVAEWLLARGFPAAAYHGSCREEDRVMMEQALLQNRLKALVSTSALGMGFDKPDLGFVVHFQRPASVVDYYQQIGRAGRAIPEARCILLCGSEDGVIHANLRKSSFPSIHDLERIVAVLEKEEAMPANNLGLRTDISAKRLHHALRHLEIGGAVQGFETDAGWSYARTANAWKPPIQRIEEITALREKEWQRLEQVVGGQVCILRGIGEALDDPHVLPQCGQCSICRQIAFETAVPAIEVAKAQQYYNDRAIILAPRKQWMEMDGRRPTIPPELRPEPGRALSKYQDAGWGHLVKEGKYETHSFDAALVEASVSLIRERWKECIGLTHVTFIPSRSDDAPVGAFAQQVADRLGIPLLHLLRRNPTGFQQKEFSTSQHQLKHAREAYALVGDVPSGTRILLVDDLVDSGWTFTVVGAELKARGAAAVYPFALADAGHVA